MTAPEPLHLPTVPELLPNSEPPRARGFEGLAREDEAWLRLSFVNMTARHCRLALGRWSTPHALLEAARRGRRDELLATRGLSEATVNRLEEASAQDLSPALRAIEENQIWLLRHGDPLYPPALRAIEDAPVLLWVRGTIEPQDEIAVGMVGTRDVTEYGKGMAGRIARDLAGRGITVVSGLALGIDTYAHRGALEGGGRTLACCGCGLDIVYPSPNRQLMRDIIENGAMISEYAPTMKAQGWHFPARNRIISGLSAGVVVVEAAEKSGALITAAFAVEQGREVFAVPGNVLKVQSRGPHGLIKQGATLVEKAQDIVDVLKARSLPFERAGDFAQASAQAALKADAARQNTLPFQTEAGEDPEDPQDQAQVLEAEREPLSSVEPRRAALPEASKSAASSAMLDSVPRGLSAEEDRALGALGWEARHIDEIAAQAGLGAGQASATLLMLELKRLARRLPGGMFERLE